MKPNIDGKCPEESYFNQNGSNAHTKMEQPPTVILQSPRPRSVSFCSSVGTTERSHTADLAVWMLPSRLRNWLVPTQPPTTETVTLIPRMNSRRRQVPPTSSIAGIAVAFIKFLTATGLVALSVLFVFVLAYRRAVSFMKWMCTDETDEPCNRQLQTKAAEKTNRRKQSGKCVVPAYPEHGKYKITNAPAAKPGESFESLKLTVKCLPDYGVLGTEIVFCIDGSWSDSVPKCVRFCKLDNNTSVHYHCLVTGSIEGHRACNTYEPSGTVVRPECSSPNYYSAVTLPFMRCIDGSWDYVAVCSPECGRVTPNGVDLIIGGRPAKRGELPWHVGIYRKTTKPYMQICGGSLVSNRLVISAAHCFWNDVIKLLPASKFAVAAGKIYRPWNNHRDELNAQKSDVREIEIPVRFQGNAANFQDDIAMLVLKTPFVYQPTVRPVCLNFDIHFDTRQLQPGNLGKVAGWGLTAENGKASQILKVVKLPYVDIEQCIAILSQDFREYITSDKICAGYGNGTALCQGDSGGGLAFPEFERGADRYYLRGIASTAAAANNENLCNSYALTTFTQIQTHEHFVMGYL